MKNVGLLAAFVLFSHIFSTQAQTSYDLSKDKVLYTVGYSHLDTEWNWDYPTTINYYIKNIMLENFHLFEKYPAYVFNFTGSRRYEMMKEYYPELYPKVGQYIKEGRWRISGSSVDEGEVNISSSESLIRQVLYGNQYFKKEFGKESVDYMLPDCFGFLANTPTIWNHCGLLGFSTQKLSWNSAVGIPFNVGVWKGPDGKGIIAALNATSYTGTVNERLDLDSYWINRLDDNYKKYGFSFDYRYYGVGDEGGAPRERDVKNVIGSVNQPDSKFKVVLSSSDQLYKDITPKIRQKLPVYSGDLLLIEHSAGSMTSQAYMKRMNRKNEILAESAEKLASYADWMGRIPYPTNKLNKAWNLLLGSQFHDILPGTSIPKAYEYAWNDEFIAANGFANVLSSSMTAVSSKMNTNVQGRSLVVFNPVAQKREDLVTAEMVFTNKPDRVQVFDGTGKALPIQIINRDGTKWTLLFMASVPSSGLAVFEVRENTTVKATKTELKSSSNSLENKYYKVTFAPNGDIASIVDKSIGKELLAQPASLQFLHEKPSVYPAWNMDWKDRKLPIVGTMDESASLRIVESGPVRVTMEVIRKGKNSVICQRVSLTAGEAGKRLEVSNILDWKSTGVSLKAAFPLTASNAKATYNLGVGTIQRGNNDSLKFEVPAKEWFDLTDRSGKYGVTILEDCKYGSDKPDDRTLRLTLMYTPETGSRFAYQNSQDWGVHEFRYGLYSHAGNLENSQAAWQGQFFNRPLLAFETNKHDGDWGRAASLLGLSESKVNVMAFKKLEDGDGYLIRVQELLGKDVKGVNLQLPAEIAEAWEVNGQEQKVGSAKFSGKNLSFDLGHFGIRSFAFKFKAEKNLVANQVSLDLPFDQDAMSFDDNRDDCNFNRRSSLPAELIPAEIVNEGIRFKMGNSADRQNNVLACNGQKLMLGSDCKKIYLLASAINDTKGVFKIDQTMVPLLIQSGTGYIGQFYNRHFAQDNVTVTSIDQPFVKTADIAWFASHGHYAYPSRNDAYQYTYIYVYEINVPQGSKMMELPVNPAIKVFAVTTSAEIKDDAQSLQSLIDDFSKDHVARKNLR
ncbi:MAG TPA: glycoside hydrolase family 38 C-terminal domain-containing protein [Bacteroidales bacterium]|nr:glycoside hydrolase family 38 C-terminal domain-containing protein [Bacteroidales bacterium]